VRSKLVVAAFTLIAAAIAPVPVHANQLLFAFTSPLGQLGTSQAYGTSPNDITAYGFYGTSNTTVNSASALYSKNQGGDEVGLGLSVDPSGQDEIQNSDFVQIDFSDPLHKLNVASVQFEFGSAQAGENWAVYGSNTLGQIGTVLSSVQSGWGSADATMLNLPNWGTYTYYSFAAAAGDTAAANVELGTIQINTSATPEPATYLMMGGALIAAAMIGRKKRRAV
jgi:hypothetical protein